MDYGFVGWLFWLLVNATGRVAVWLFLWAPHPSIAYEPGSYGARSRVGTTYRLLWRLGQLVVRLVVIGVVALMVWLIYFR